MAKRRKAIGKAIAGRIQVEGKWQRAERATVGRIRVEKVRGERRSEERLRAMAKSPRVIGRAIAGGIEVKGKCPRPAKSQPNLT